MLASVALVVCFVLLHAALVITFFSVVTHVRVPALVGRIAPLVQSTVPHPPITPHLLLQLVPHYKQHLIQLLLTHAELNGGAHWKTLRYRHSQAVGRHPPVGRKIPFHMKSCMIACFNDCAVLYSLIQLQTSARKALSFEFDGSE